MIKTNINKIKKYFQCHLLILLFCLFLPVQTVFAVMYDPGETLEPACAPTDVDCGVTSPVYTEDTLTDGALLFASSSAWSLLSAGSDGQVLKLSGGLPTWGSDDNGTNYTAGSGLSLVGSSFALNLSSTNTWLGIQTFGNGFIVDGDTITDLTGTGLGVSGGILSTTLGTNIESAEITDGTIINDDISSSASIADVKLAQLTTSNKVAGSVVELVASGGLENSSGLKVKLNGTGLSLSADGLALNLENTNTWSGAQTFSSAISAPTSSDTINGLVINSGGLSGITGLTMTSGNLDMANGLITNIGNAGTDFDSSGGLTLASNLTMSGSGANLILGSNYLSGDGDDEGIFVDSNGSVGIGTTAPASDLHIHRPYSFGTNLRFTDVETTNGFTIGLSSISSAVNIWNYEGTPMNFGTSNLNRLTIDAGGDIGIGTETPTAKLHVQGDIKATGLDIGLSGSEGSITSIDGLKGYNDLKFYGDSFGGPDIFIGTDGKVGIGTGEVTALIDLAIGDSDTGLEQVSDGELAIYTDNSERVRITHDGNVGIHVADPAIDLAIGDSDTGFKQEGDGHLAILTNNSERVRINSAGYVGIGNNNPGYLLTMGAGGGYYNQGTGAWMDGSDRALKDNIADLSKYGLSTLQDLRPVSYTMKHSGEEGIGFIAQELKPVIPELVSGEDGHMGVNYGGFAPVLVKAILEQQDQIEALQAGSLVSLNTLDDLVLSGGLSIAGEVDLGKDTIGEAVIRTGATSVEIVFGNKYNYQPVVTISKMTAGTLSDYYASDVTVNGFKIVIDPAQSDKNITFSWHAFGSKNGVRLFSDGLKEDIEVINANLSSEPSAVLSEHSTGSPVSENDSATNEEAEDLSESTDQVETIEPEQGEEQTTQEESESDTTEIENTDQADELDEAPAEETEEFIEPITETEQAEESVPVEDSSSSETSAEKTQESVSETPVETPSEPSGDESIE